MSRDPGVHQFGSVVRRRASLSLGLRRGGGQLLLSLRSDLALRGGGRRCAGHISDPPAGHRLSQVLPVPAQSAQKEEERRPKRQSSPRESYPSQQRSDREPTERSLQPSHAPGDVPGELREGQYLLTIRHRQYRCCISRLELCRPRQSCCQAWSFSRISVFQMAPDCTASTYGVRIRLLSIYLS